MLSDPQDLRMLHPAIRCEPSHFSPGQGARDYRRRKSPSLGERHSLADASVCMGVFGTFCYNGFASGEDDAGTSENARSFAMHNSILVVQLVLLLGVFLKPMLVPAEGTQSGGAIYKRVVVRNVVCTACIVTAYVIMTAVAVLALLNETADNNQAAQVRDMAIAVNQLVVLCLTEVSLPLGFASCCKAIGTVRKQEGQASRPVNGAADAVTKTKVIPVEVLPPQIP